MTRILLFFLLFLLCLLSLSPHSSLAKAPYHRHPLPSLHLPNLYPITDSALGPRFDGVGAISGGGSTSRLLPAYRPSVLSQVLDYLFAPNFGAAFHWLKVEIGGEALSSEGAEASHARTLDELQTSPNYARGYEWQLMVQAKRRNPSIRLYGLAWTWPGYLGPSSPWTNPQLTANYSLSWVVGARRVHGLHIDVLGVWNERSFSSPYVKALRRGLDAAGFPDTAILCDDSKYACAAELMADAELAAAVTYLGGHDPATAQARATGKAVWFSEDFHSNGGEAGAAVWAGQINSRYIEYNMTATLAWNAVDAFYRGLAFDDTGLMSARCPWSDSYEVLATIWATAHTTQFTQPGWHYLPVGNGSGPLRAGGSYVTYVNATGSQRAFTLVVEKFSGDGRGVAEETAQFCLAGSLVWAKGATLAVWKSTFHSTATPSYFSREAGVTVDSNGCFTLDVAVNSLWTVTTLTTGGKGQHPTPPACGPFPLPFHDTFDSCTPPAEANYFHDVSGAWECVAGADAHGTVMRLQTPTRPVSWEPSADTTPVGVFGDRSWADVNVTLDVRLNAASESFMLAARANLGNATGYAVLQAEYVWAGLWLAFDTSGRWALQDHANHAKVIRQGKLPAAPAVGEWHTYSLVVRGPELAGYQDGRSIFSAVDVSAQFGTGWVGYGALRWGHHPDFDNFRVEAV